MKPERTQTRPEWARQRQPSPPNFGRAKRVPRWRLALETWNRRGNCARIIKNSASYCESEPGLVSLVILSCKRLPELRRLCETVVPFFSETETAARLEKILVDNGSGPALIDYARGLDFFDEIVAHSSNIGMAAALNDAFPKCRGEYILLLEDDFILEYPEPFLQRCVAIFSEYPEIGIIRLKNQNNWGKPFRRIAPLRTTSEGIEFWTWLPSADGEMNVWTSGSVLFRKVSFFSADSIPVGPNVSRDHALHQGFLYERVYSRRYNKIWLAAKIKDCYPFVQPNDNDDSPGWGEVE